MIYEDILSFDTKLTADVVDWRPLLDDLDYSSILACGTYYLEKEKNQRLGCLYILDINENEKSLKICNKLNYENSGILDLKWIDQKNMITIDSSNKIKLISFDQDNLTIECLQQLSLVKNEISIGLTLDFMKKDNNFKILTSDNLGNLNLINIQNQNFHINKQFKAHDYEIWSVLIDKNEENIFYSGADDCILKIWDLRQSEKKAVSECNIFSGGVCSIILPQRNDKNLSIIPNYSSNDLLCGSYDERIYVLDKRNMKKSKNQSNKLNGGVWKMKLHAKKDHLLCACMHTGLHIVNTKTLDSCFYYDKHGINNLAYGCDWKPHKIDTNDIIASCSFYNHELRIWKITY